MEYFLILWLRGNPRSADSTMKLTRVHFLADSDFLLLVFESLINCICSFFIWFISVQYSTLNYLAIADPSSWSNLVFLAFVLYMLIACISAFLSLWHCLILLTCSGSAWQVITVTKIRKTMIENYFAGMYLLNLSYFGMESTSQQSHAFCNALTLPTYLRMTGNIFTKWSARYIHKFCLYFFCISRAKLLQKVMITPKADLISIKSTITFSLLLYLAWNLVDIILVHYLILWIVIL